MRRMKLKVSQSTIFKQSTEESSKLPERDKVAIASGKVFNIHSWKPVDHSHLRIAIIDEALGDPSRNTWYVFMPHVQLINDKGQVVPVKQETPRVGVDLPATKRLNVPHKSQLDNALNPTGACNVTSFAMIMAYLQIKGRTGVGQLEDELYRYMEGVGLSRWDPEDLAKMASNYGVKDEFTTRAKPVDIRKAIALGYPCIIHGYFTSFGHIIVVRGYDPYGFFVNDPYGEWTSNGYNNDVSGANLYYSNALIQSKCSPEGEDFLWLHRLSKK